KMILSEQKPFEEIVGYMEGEKSVFLLGCNGCAQSSGSGGSVQVEEMKTRLEESGKKVTGIKAIDFLCEKALVKSGLRGKIEQLVAADSILVMTCGIGVQAVAASVNKVCHPACNTVNLGGSRGEWQGSERCQECGQCLLDYTGGICPLGACTKSLISGACGGASAGKCEISPDRDCGWELIYNRLKAKNQLSQLKVFVNPLDHSKLMPSPAIMSTPRYALESLYKEGK
ncbi:methylenetetrahydrofolate reductase C-terminal domain-containing protein, partial [Chloroflexota bacterium]